MCGNRFGLADFLYILQTAITLGRRWDRKSFQYSTVLYLKTHTNKPATQHGCLPCLLGDGEKGTELVYGDEKIFSLVRAAKAEQKTLAARQAQRTNQERPLSFVLFDSPFTSFQQSAGQGHPSLVSLAVRTCLYHRGYFLRKPPN